MNKLLGISYLHCLVYIVADTPLKGNISQKVPLVGTSSYKRLLMWIGEMDIDITRVRLYNQGDAPFDDSLTRSSLNHAIELNQIRVIALGQKAVELKAQNPTLTCKQCYDMTKGIKGKRKND